MIKQIHKNQFIDSKGASRYLFTTDGIDLEQLEADEIKLKFQRFKSRLNHLPSGKSYKFYSINNKFIFDTPKETKEQGIYSTLTPFNEGLAPFIFSKNVLADPLFKDDYCKINGVYLRFVTIDLLEDHFIDIGGLQRFGDYFISFFRMSTTFAKLVADDARKLSHTSLYSTLSDIEGIEQYKENEQMLRSIITREEELFKTTVTFIVSAATEGDLLTKSNVLTEELMVSGLSPSIATHSLNSVFRSYIGGMAPNMVGAKLFHSSLLLNCLPIHKDSIASDGVQFNARSGALVYINTSKGDSYSSCITGVTGKGKTFLANKLIDYDYHRGQKLFIIDPKRDYRKQALLKNATIVDESINPMIFKDAKYLHTLILSQVPQVERTKLWEGQLLRAIRETGCYEQKSFFKALDLLKSKGFKDLEFYFESIREQISEKKMELADFTYIEFGSFGNQILPFLLSFSFEYVTRLNAPYNLVIDEAHRVFKHNPEFLEERVREVRASNSALTLITQSYNHLTQTDFGKVVADNCYHKFFFAQNLYDTEVTEFDRINIDGLETHKGEFSEFYYKTDAHRKAVRFIPTHRELELFNSEKEQTEKMLSYIKKNLPYFTINQCINQWVGGVYV